MKKMMLIMVAAIVMIMSAAVVSADPQILSASLDNRVRQLVHSGEYEYVYAIGEPVDENILTRMSDIYTNYFNNNDDAFRNAIYQPIYEKGYTYDNFISVPEADNCYVLHSLKDDSIKYITAIETDDKHYYFTVMGFNSQNQFLGAKISYAY